MNGEFSGIYFHCNGERTSTPTNVTIVFLFKLLVYTKIYFLLLYQICKK
jgi:hypothetical protein